jgi:hypothetical protein
MDPNWLLVVVTAVYTIATIIICWANWRSSSAAQKQIETMLRIGQLGIVPVMTLKEYKPYLYFYGGEKGVFPFPRMGLNIEICNKSNSTIVELDGRISIVLPGEKLDIFFTDRFGWPLIDGFGDSTGLQSVGYQDGDSAQVARFLEAITGSDDQNPILISHFKYKNILGAGYEYRQKRYLKAWHEKKDAHFEFKKISSQLLSPDANLQRFLDLISVATNGSKKNPIFEEIVREYLGENISSNKIDYYEISIIEKPGDFRFRSISDQNYQDLDFSRDNIILGGI